MKRAIAGGIVMCAVVGLCVTGALSGNRSDDPLGVAVSPQTLRLDSVQSGEVKVHTDIPLGTVNRDSLTLNGIPAVDSFADSRGNLVAVFSETEVKAAVAPSRAILTLEGVYKTGESFAGSDSVRVVQ